jgi:hypothetical protein
MIALYKGISSLSRVIRWANRAIYSHAAWIDPESGACYEAWTHGGVRKVPSFSSAHTPGTQLDIFATPATREQSLTIRRFLEWQIGKPYDWRGILHFVTRRPEYPRDQDRWFCSELVFAAYRSAGVPLLARVDAFTVSPGMLSWSPLLVHVRSAVCGGTDYGDIILNPDGTPSSSLVDGHLPGVLDFAPCAPRPAHGLPAFAALRM